MTDAPDDDVILEAFAIEKYEPDLSTAYEDSVPAIFQERFIVRFAYGITDARANDSATRILGDHPDFFLAEDDAWTWGKANCPPGMAFGVTMLLARVSLAEIAKYARDDD